MYILKDINIIGPYCPFFVNDELVDHSQQCDGRPPKVSTVILTMWVEPFLR